MQKLIFTLIAIVCLLSAWGIGDAQAFRLVTREMIEEEVVVETDLVKTVDNFIILFDSSSSTNQDVPGKTISKVQATKAFLKERNAWFPDLGYQAGLYLYTNVDTLTNTFKAIYPVQPYDRDGFAVALDELPDKGRGPTMLQAGFKGLRKVLDNLPGKTGVILFTDGNISQTQGPKSALQIAQEIARDHNVCFYLISSATETVNKKLLEAVSKVNACSRVIPLAAFMDYPGYLTGALFTVETSTYVRLKPTTEVVGFVANDMLFDFDSAVIRSEYYDKLEMLGKFLQNNPNAYVIAAGFSDSSGNDEYNLALSKRRATSVQDYLSSNSNITKDRIVTLWFGELTPVGDNTTKEGRQRNRRVGIAVGGIQ
jgi:OOP family OmpA-OmpF porin